MAPPRVSAKERLRRRLAEIGLPGLTNWWYQRKTAGWSDAEIWLAVRDTPAYKARFPGLEKLRAEGRPMTERAWIDYERTVHVLARQYDYPAELLTNQRIGSWIAQEKSPQEMQARFEANLAVAQSKDPVARAELRRIYNITDGQIAAWLSDPADALPVLQRRVSGALLSAEGVRTGFGGLSRSEAEGLAGLDVTAGEAQERFGALVESRELMSALDAGEDDISRSEQLGAAFAGDTLAQQRIERQRRRRLAVGEAGGGFAADREGFSGLGSAST